MRHRVQDAVHEPSTALHAGESHGAPAPVPPAVQPGRGFDLENAGAARSAGRSFARAIASELAGGDRRFVPPAASAPSSALESRLPGIVVPTSRVERVDQHGRATRGASIALPGEATGARYRAPTGLHGPTARGRAREWGRYRVAGSRSAVAASANRGAARSARADRGTLQREPVALTQPASGYCEAGGRRHTASRSGVRRSVTFGNVSCAGPQGAL